MGGYSAEREISLLSGQAVYKALTEAKIKCFSFDLNEKNLDDLWKMKFDKAFIVLHGRGGEDGYIQSELNKKNIPFVFDTFDEANCSEAFVRSIYFH